MTLKIREVTAKGRRRMGKKGGGGRFNRNDDHGQQQQQSNNSPNLLNKLLMVISLIAIYRSESFQYLLSLSSNGISRNAMAAIPATTENHQHLSSDKEGEQQDSHTNLRSPQSLEQQQQTQPRPVMKVLKTQQQLEEDHASWMEQIQSYVSTIGHSLEGGNIIMEQAVAYRRLLDETVVRIHNNNTNNNNDNAVVVCETGFFHGVSAHLWLDAMNKSISTGHDSGSSSSGTLHSFDIQFDWNGTKLLQEQYGGSSSSSSPQSSSSLSLVTHVGPTGETLKAFHPAQPCQLLSVDGSHDGYDPYNDLVELLPNTECGSIVLFDDTFDSPTRQEQSDPRQPNFFNDCSKSFFRAVNESLIDFVRCHNFGRKPRRWGLWPKGYCVGIAKVGGGCIEKSTHESSIVATKS